MNKMIFQMMEKIKNSRMEGKNDFVTLRKEIRQVSKFDWIDSVMCLNKISKTLSSIRSHLRDQEETIKE